MSLNGLLNQTLSVYNKSSFDAYGREVVGTATDIKARVQQTTKQRLLPTGALITIEIVAYVKSDASVNVGDRIKYDSKYYKVYGRYAAVDDTGNVDHYKLELTKWQT